MSQQPMILPKGIVLNSPEIYAEVASYPVVPPEKIWQYWHVYTTTFRRLIDPTAYRLENFWWHVWGSDRRFLSGSQLAKLFEEFSTGPTFVPLRGPPNRYEGPPTPRKTHPTTRRGPSRPGPGKRAQSEQDVDVKQQSESHLRNRNRNPNSPEKGSLKEPTPSSSRPPPAHTILKKPRGPSTSGPRPTARFVTPDEEDENVEEKGEDKDESQGDVPREEVKVLVKKAEVTKEEEEPSRSKSTDSLDMPPPPIPRQEKKATPTGKKFIASTSSSKRRPHMPPRRQSSQSSTEGSSAGSAAKYLGSHRLSQTSVTMEPGRQTRGDSSSSADRPVINVKASGKRPEKEKTSAPTPPSRDREGTVRLVVVQQQPQLLAASPSRSPHTRSINGHRSPPTASYEVIRSRNQAPRAPVAGFLAEAALEAQAHSAPMMTRSRSSNMDGQSIGPFRSRDSTSSTASTTSITAAGGGRLPQTLIASSVVGMSTTTVQGQFDSDGMILPASSLPLPRDIPDELASRQSATSLRHPGLAPTPPSPAPTVPFGRSKSQLRLLLETEKARIGDGRAGGQSE